MKLSIGCGDRRLPGYTGVDAVQRAAVDIVAPATKIPLPDGVADEVLAIHLLEHLFEWEAPDALAEWYRLLKPGGKLVLEMPDFMKSCRNIAEGIKGKKHDEQMGLWGVFGDPRAKDPFMMHKTGWWFKRLKPFVEGVGFVHVTEYETQFHGAGRGLRDFRLEAEKPKA